MYKNKNKLTEIICGNKKNSLNNDSDTGLRARIQARTIAGLQARQQSARTGHNAAARNSRMYLHTTKTTTIFTLCYNRSTIEHTDDKEQADIIFTSLFSMDMHLLL